jgi:predicted nucleic acid-binding protein
VRIYLDACCLNRPFDNQLQARIRLESEAVLVILQRANQGEWTLLTSAALEFELNQIPDPQRRARTLQMISTIEERAIIRTSEIHRAKLLQEICGIRALDALHIACAESLQADIFLTTDDRLLRAVQRGTEKSFSLIFGNPLTWLTDKPEQP